MADVQHILYRHKQFYTATNLPMLLIETATEPCKIYQPSKSHAVFNCSHFHFCDNNTLILVQRIHEFPGVVCSYYVAAETKPRMNLVVECVDETTALLVKLSF